MKKIKLLICALLVFTSCENLEDLIFDDDSESQKGETYLSAGDTLTVTHTGNSQALFYAIVVDSSQLTGEEYKITFENINNTPCWILKNSFDELIHLDSLFPANEEYYVTLDSSQLLSYRINNAVTDGFIVYSKNATFNNPTTYSSAETITDDFPITSLVFEGIFQAEDANDGTWAGFLETTTMSQPPSRPRAEDLMLDIEFRFTENGSYGTYFNGNLSILERITFPFEVWSVEQDRQIDAALYHYGGGTPLFEEDPDYPGSYKFTINFWLIPIYQDYTGVALANYFDNPNMGWCLRFNKYTSVFEPGNVFRVNFFNPLVIGEDSYIIESLQ